MLFIFLRELLRIWRVAAHSLVAPIVQGGIYIILFAEIIGSRFDESGNYTLIAFTGILTLMSIQSSFQNVLGSISNAKMTGDIEEWAFHEVSAYEFVLGFISASIIRSLFIVTALTLAIHLMGDVKGIDAPLDMVFIILTATTSGILGALLGFILVFNVKSPENSAAIQSIIFTPLIYLSGAVFPFGFLSENIKFVMLLNPFFHANNMVRATVGIEEWNFLGSIFILGFSVLTLFAVSIKIANSKHLYNRW